MRTVVIDQLTPEEKLDLIDELWCSLASEDFPLTQAQLEELDRRIAASDNEPGIPWDEVEGRLRQRLR
jgi:putative addiction module component (TIGR02574 family)